MPVQIADPTPLRRGHQPVQYELFRANPRPPTTTVWAASARRAAAKLAGQLDGGMAFLLEGCGESDGPNSDEWRLSFWLRYSLDMAVCALCVQDEATGDWEPPPDRGEPEPVLIYTHPHTSNLEKLAQMLIAEYFDMGGRSVLTVEVRGRYDLGAYFEDWVS